VETSLGHAAAVLALLLSIYVPLRAAEGTYNQTVLGDRPVAFWKIQPRSSTEPDLSGNGNTGRYQGGSPAVATLPNGGQAAVFTARPNTLPSRPSRIDPDHW
jgi:hypothetical protein